MTMTRKQAAQRLLDTIKSRKRMYLRGIFAILQAMIVSILIGYFTSWHFGLAALLLMGLLIQFAFDRMSNSIKVKPLDVLKDIDHRFSFHCFD